MHSEHRAPSQDELKNIDIKDKESYGSWLPEVIWNQLYDDHAIVISSKDLEELIYELLTSWQFMEARDQFLEEYIQEYELKGEECSQCANDED